MVSCPLGMVLYVGQFALILNLAVISTPRQYNQTWMESYVYSDVFYSKKKHNNFEKIIFADLSKMWSNFTMRRTSLSPLFSLHYKYEGIQSNYSSSKRYEPPIPNIHSKIPGVRNGQVFLI